MSMSQSGDLVVSQALFRGKGMAASSLQAHMFFFFFFYENHSPLARRHSFRIPQSACTPGLILWIPCPLIAIPPSRVTLKVSLAANVGEQKRPTTSPEDRNKV